MATIDCNQFMNEIEAWMEGEHSAKAEAHIRSCPTCRGFVEDLNSISQTAPSLAVNDEPPARLWVSLRTQLETEGIIHEPPARKTSTVRHWLDEAFNVVPRPAFAGAYLVALVALSVALGGPIQRHVNENPWINSAEISTQPLSAQLDTAEKDTVSEISSSDPMVAASLQKNLAIVDNYIALCKKSVQEEPGSEVARDYLYDAYQQKADLLAQMTDHGDETR
jgi:hypothetical protein